jgi:hypothetical protein
MPKLPKYRGPVEVGSLFGNQLKESPISSILTELEEREKLNKILHLAMKKMGLEQFSTDIAIGEINDHREINLLAKKATVITKLKNKLPSLLNFFRESGYPLVGIHLKVSPKLSSTLVSTSIEPPLEAIITSDRSKKAWEDLEKNLELDSPLRKAVKNLLKKIN